MADEYRAPTFGVPTFTCPHCAVIAGQDFVHRGNGPRVDASTCRACNQAALWIDEVLVYPRPTAGPPPHDDLIGPALHSYKEARAIVGDSPRAAAALLRLAIERLLVDEASRRGVGGGDLNSCVGALVKDGLHPQTQRALDVVRVVGNNSVHPGEINVEDDPQVAQRLFLITNAIVDDLISKPRVLEEMYRDLPEGAREAIDRRDATPESS